MFSKPLPHRAATVSTNYDMKITRIIILTFLYFTNSYSQTNKDTAIINKDTTKNQTKYSEPKRIVFSPGVAYQGQWTGEYTMMYADYDMGPCGYSVSGLRIGSEFVFNNSKTILAPKIGYQAAGMLICLRVSEINYLHNSTIDVRLLPEIGFDFITAFNICYGYNFHIIGDKYKDITNHRITLTANLYLDPKRKKK